MTRKGGSKDYSCPRVAVLVKKRKCSGGRGYEGKGAKPKGVPPVNRAETSKKTKWARPRRYRVFTPPMRGARDHEGFHRENIMASWRQNKPSYRSTNSDIGGTPLLEDAGLARWAPKKPGEEESMRRRSGTRAVSGYWGKGGNFLDRGAGMVLGQRGKSGVTSPAAGYWGILVCERWNEGQGLFRKSWPEGARVCDVSTARATR